MSKKKYTEEEIKKIVSGVDSIVSKARKAQAEYELNADQKLYDSTALAVGWALMNEDNNRFLSEMAVDQTGLGKVEDKITKNFRKTFGLLRDLKELPTTGIVRDDEKSGIIEILRPVGVVGAVVPSTNPVATPTNNIINALKCGNAVVLAPSPKGAAVCHKLLELIHTNLKRVGVNTNLVQALPAPISKVATARLMEIVDLLVVTGSQDNVRRAYSSGVPAVGVGAGNVSVIIDESADLKSAAEKITASKTFDNSTSCSSENNLIVLDSVFDKFIEELSKVGGYLPEEKDALAAISKIRVDGKLNTQLIGQDIEKVLEVFGWEFPSEKIPKFILLPTENPNEDNPLCDEKMSLIASLFRASDFQDATEIARKIFSIKGAGHSIGLHTNQKNRAVELGLALPTCRVIVNQAHCFATGGAFNNSLPFSLSMGCGTWGGNSIDENLNYKHFLNRTKIVHPIPEQMPTLDDIFSEYWKEYGA